MSHVWHFNLIYVSNRDMTLLSYKHLLLDIEKIDLKFCEHFAMSKHKRQFFGAENHSSKEFLKYVQSGVCICFSRFSLSRKLYYIFFIDDYSKFVWIYFLILKSSTFATFENLKTKLRHKFYRRWKIYLRIMAKNKLLIEVTAKRRRLFVLSSKLNLQNNMLCLRVLIT